MRRKALIFIVGALIGLGVNEQAHHNEPTIAPVGVADNGQR